MQVKSICDYFNDTPLYSWDGSKWVDLKNKGSVSNIYGGMDAVSVDAGERRLVADKPLPDSCTVVRLGRAGAEAYVVGFRPDVIHSANANEPFSYIVHRAHDQTEVWRAVKTNSAAGVPASIEWTKVQTTYSNPAHHDNDKNTIFPDTIFSGYSVVLPSDCVATADDELRTAKGIYVIQSIYNLNSVQIALSHRKAVAT